MECEHIGHEVLVLYALDDDEGRNDECEIEGRGEGGYTKDLYERLGENI